MTRSLSEIAYEIYQDWATKSGKVERKAKNIYHGAVPYLQAMMDMRHVSDSYGLEYGDMIVAYFLSNATTWRGETARRVKAELNQMLKEYNNAKRT